MGEKSLSKPIYMPAYGNRGRDKPKKPAAAGFFLGQADVSRIIEMAWEDRTPFEAIEAQFGMDESAVVRLMRSQMKTSSFKMWRKRMKARTTKHANLRDQSVTRHRASHTRQN